MRAGKQEGRLGRRPGRGGPRLALGAVTTLGLIVMLARPGAAWTVMPHEDTLGLGIRWQEGRWSGELLVPSSRAAPLGRDKIQHMLAGAMIATALRLGGADVSTAMGAALLAGTLKELGDSGRIPGVPRGQVELGDWIATGLGGLLGVWSTRNVGGGVTASAPISNRTSGSPASGSPMSLPLSREQESSGGW